MARISLPSLKKWGIISCEKNYISFALTISISSPLLITTLSLLLISPSKNNLANLSSILSCTTRRKGLAPRAESKPKRANSCNACSVTSNCTPFSSSCNSSSCINILAISTTSAIASGLNTTMPSNLFNSSGLKNFFNSWFIKVSGYWSKEEHPWQFIL